jgi:UDPglucose--hexose-1-phosphate uridylyltransferase
MTISFNKIEAKARIMNPFKDFVLDEIPLEIRFDPLTGQTGRVFDLPYRPPARPDLSKIIQKSKEIFCPFCPDVLEKSTPLFPEEVVPGGRIMNGQALLIPNLLPLDKYACVSILSPEHYIAIEELTTERMADAFYAALKFFKMIARFDPLVNFYYINWNYMPPAGSSIVHPHLQVNCGEVPTNQHRIQMEACRKYYEENGSHFWLDFIEAEQELEERFIGETGSTFWFMSYVPQSFLPDIWCIFSEHNSLTGLEKDEFFPFIKGLSKILKYFSLENIFSFNMSIFSVKEDDYFRINARVCPRLLTREIGNSDQTYLQTIHKETYSVWPPESVCQKIKEIFRG